MAFRRLASNLFSRYSQVNETHPRKTQILTTAILMATGDVASQILIEKKNKLDLMRTGRFFLVGCIYVGPVLTMWYIRVDKIVPKAASFRGVKMMLVDQLAFAPIFIPGLLATVGSIQGQSIKEIKGTIEKDYFSILLTNWMLWPAAQLINFNLVPIQFRVVFAGGVALVWNTYLAWKANQGAVKDKSKKMSGS